MDYAYRNGELYHARSHKYIKRELKNGKWRYWYPADVTKDSYYKWQSHLYGDFLEADKKTSKRLNIAEEVNEKKSQSIKAYKENRDYINWQRERNKEYTQADGRNYAAAMQQLGRIEYTENQRLINRAKNWLANLSKKKS